MSHLPGVYQRVPNAVCTPCYISVGIDCGPYLKHSYRLDWQSFPPAVGVGGVIELVGSAPTARLLRIQGRLTLTVQFELRITVLLVRSKKWGGLGMRLHF